MSEDNPIQKVFHDIYLRRHIFNFNHLFIDDSIRFMKLSCDLGVEMYLENIFRYTELIDDGIITIIYGNKIRSVKSYVFKKISSCRKNCCMLVIKSKLNNKINIELMNNGTIYIHGSRSINECKNVLKKLIKNLSKEFGIRVNNLIIDKLLVNDINNLSINKLKVMSIKSHFKVDYNINKKVLFEILNKKILYGNTFLCRYYSSILHIIIKPIDCQVFVYSDGKFIIIAHNHDQIIEYYKYITIILNDNYNDIIKPEDDIKSQRDFQWEMSGLKNLKL